MKTRKQLKSIFLLILMIPNGCAAGSHSLIVDDDGAGKWKLGMKYSVAIQKHKEFHYILREGEDKEEGYRYRIVSVWEGINENRLIATFSLSDDDKIITITIFDPRFVTKEGIFVGAKTEDLLRAYPEHRIISRGQPILVPKGEKIEFFLPVSFPKNLQQKIGGIRIGVE